MTETKKYRGFTLTETFSVRINTGGNIPEKKVRYKCTVDETLVKGTYEELVEKINQFLGPESEEADDEKSE